MNLNKSSISSITARIVFAGATQRIMLTPFRSGINRSRYLGALAKSLNLTLSRYTTFKTNGAIIGRNEVSPRHFSRHAVKKRRRGTRYAVGTAANS